MLLYWGSGRGRRTEALRREEEERKITMARLVRRSDLNGRCMSRVDEVNGTSRLANIRVSIIGCGIIEPAFHMML